MNTVTLTEAEYFRLMKLTQDVVIANHELELAAARVRAKAQVRDAYHTHLQQAYPALALGAVVYDADDATCTLTPRASAIPKEGTT